MITHVEIALADGGAAQLPVRRSDRARRIALRLLEQEGVVELVLPRRTSLRTGVRFAQEKRRWIARQLAGLPTRIPFADGAVIPVLGDSVIVRGIRGARGKAVRANGALHVPAGSGRLAARTLQWLRSEARDAIVPRAYEKADLAGHRVHRVTVRDPVSRWGSCSSTGNLSFSWRLVLAPPFVLDYVVAHEVAHLRHLDHGPRFWKLVDELTDDSATARVWLRANGTRLKRYG